MQDFNYGTKKREEGGQVLNVIGRVLNLSGEPVRTAKVESGKPIPTGVTRISATPIRHAHPLKAARQGGTQPVPSTKVSPHRMFSRWSKGEPSKGVV